ncbi:chemotaxis protein CheD [Novosphingobium flavum]|uniref:Probable chemoreceptor glutamine deamidase CheD n=1 Tax=Novosphingobium flavum TaxID=1778672 RepID=A0A7X1FRP9_9SPHN|nr:chemotaxis protein CheD [Novosphingobium flavum]MBC2665604.1 chemotaxis protein CheD [Novosphingobium flavum]
MASAPFTPATTRITVMQGQARVSAGPRVELSTVLGSCVATCLFDPEEQVGGMNHFLLAEPPAGGAGVDEHYGVYLMELLINEMLANGAAKHRLRAHLYGGANLYPGMEAIGTANALFARNFLARERITLVREDMGGNAARRVDFRPASGMVRCRTVANTLAHDERPSLRPVVSSGEVELF